MSKKNLKKVIIAGMVGNGLEWYDYALYGQMVSVLGALFFPKSDPYVQHIAAFAVFAVGFISRPFGALLFGYLGDRFGRKGALIAAIVMMAIPTGCIGLLPTYAQIGIWAPVLLTIIRVVQGLSLGGAFSGSITYMVEHAPMKRRGLAGSLTVLSLAGGFLLGSLIASLFSHFLTPEAFQSWGWRVPFIIGVGVGFIGLYIREHCEESPTYTQAKEQGRLSATPLREALGHYPWNIVQGVLIYLLVTIPFYMLAVFLIKFTHENLGQRMDHALFINALVMIVFMIVTPFSGWLSDIYTRKRILRDTAFVTLCTAYFIFKLITATSLFEIAAGQLLFAVLISFYLGPVPTLLVELFPTRVRYTGMAVSYNVAAALFGGTTPIVCEWLTHTTGDNFSIAYYIIAVAAVSLLAVCFYKDRSREELG